MTDGLDRPAAHRIVCAVVAAEVERLRERQRPLAGLLPWAGDMRIGDDGLGLDSLERLGALGALAETFDLDDSILNTVPPHTVGDWLDCVMRRQAAGDARLVVRTSGSTGAPVPCAHAVADLIGEARALAAQVAGRRRIVALVPAHHLYGIIWAAVLPGVLGVPVVTRAIGAALMLLPGDLVVAVPDQWRAMLRLARTVPGDVIGVSSGGPMDDALAAALHDAGLARLLDIYGSSETGGIALREWPERAYTLLPRWHLVPAAGDDWQLGDQHGALYPLPDHVERLGERQLRPTGRRDGAVQVGGHNVWPARVADTLRAVDGVADAAVRLHANGRLKAFIVPAPDTDPEQIAADLDRAITDRLSAPERPCSLRFGPALPRNSMGKLEDWA